MKFLNFYCMILKTLAYIYSMPLVNVTIVGCLHVYINKYVLHSCEFLI